MIRRAGRPGCSVRSPRRPRPATAIAFSAAAASRLAGARSAAPGDVDCASSQVSSAFCAGSRLPARSNTALCGSVQHLVGDLFAAVGGEAVQHDHRRVGDRQQVGVDLYGQNGVCRSRPSPSCPMDVQVSVASTCAPAAAARGSGSTATDRRWWRRSHQPAPAPPGRGEPAGPDRYVHAGRGPGQQVRVGHVVADVAEEGEHLLGGAPRRSRMVSRSASSCRGGIRR